MKHNKRLHPADVVAVFENQDDADEAVLQMRLAGISDDHIGFFVQHPVRGMTDLLAHDRRFSGSVIGGVLGAALGVGAAWLLNQWSEGSANLGDFFGLVATLGTFGALFLGFVGWWIGADISRRAVLAPNVDPSVGPFILAVDAGNLRDRAWSAIRAHGGHELPPGGMMAQPAAI